MLLSCSSPVGLSQGPKGKVPVTVGEGIYPQYVSKREVKMMSQHVYNEFDRFKDDTEKVADPFVTYTPQIIKKEMIIQLATVKLTRGYTKIYSRRR